MKKKIKITESDIRALVTEAVKNILVNEGTSDETAINAWEQVKEVLGTEVMLESIFHWSSSSQIDQYLQWFDEEYDLNLFEEEEEDYDEEYPEDEYDDDDIEF